MWGCLLLVLTSCQGIDEQSSTTLRVHVQGMMSSTEIEVRGGETYLLEADGDAELGQSRIELMVYDTSGALAGQALVRLSNDLTGAQDGDSGYGDLEVIADSGTVQDVTIPFAWNAGAQIDSGWNVGMEFSRGPDIGFWSVTPAPYIQTGTNFTVMASLSSNVDAVGDLDVWLDLDDVDVRLTFDTTLGFHTGDFTAPTLGGVYLATIRGRDSEGAESSVAKVLYFYENEADVADPGTAAIYFSRRIRIRREMGTTVEELDADGKVIKRWRDFDEDGKWDVVADLETGEDWSFGKVGHEYFEPGPPCRSLVDLPPFDGIADEEHVDKNGDGDNADPGEKTVLTGDSVPMPERPRVPQPPIR